ncbi:putative glucokinase [Xylariaceae sp. FL0804]|nr:putative glucokinase [Xylariaceae sp. FL0804]
MSQDSRHGISLHAQVEDIIRQFELDQRDVQKLTEHFMAHMKHALDHVGPSQIPSYVTKIPDGTEKGLFLAVDLGGTNCRVCSIELHGDSRYTLVQSKYAVPRNVRVAASYKPLFSFIARRIQDFLSSHREIDVQGQPHDRHSSGSGDERRKLGFTFSFTCHQDSLQSGTLLHWDKGWDIPDALGRSPCAMLQEAIDELQLPIHVAALANDSVGTLMARAYESPEKSSTLMGAIFGTGTNAAYVEKLAKITKVHHQAGFGAPCPEALMVVNTEWGCFDDEMAVLPDTPWDQALDSASQDPGSQMLEKRVSGLYLGELLRLCVLQLHGTGGLDMVLSPGSRAFEREGVDSSVLSSLSMDNGESPDRSRGIVTEAFEAKGVSLGDAQAVQMIAEAISTRAARLSAAAIAAVIAHAERLQPTWHPQEKAPEPEDPKMPFISQISGPPFGRGIAAFSNLFVYFRYLVQAMLKMLCRHHNKPPSSTPAVRSATDSQDSEVIDIGVDGSLIEHHPTFGVEVRNTLRAIFGEEARRIRIELARDGSGVGAALMALSAALDQRMASDSQ